MGVGILRKSVLAVVAAGLIALNGYLLWDAYGPKKSETKYRAVPVPYIVYRDILKRDEVVMVEPCVPVERVVPVGSTRPPDAPMFPLNLGNLTIGSLPYGGRVELGLIEGKHGAGVPEGLVVPNPAPRFEWLGDLSGGLGAGQSLLDGTVLRADLRASLFRYKRFYLEATVEGETSSSGDSDVRAVINGRYLIRDKRF